MNELKIQPIKNRFGIIGNSSNLNYAIQVASQVAPTELTILITGESGSGKESFSKIIHHLSPRRHAGFIAINCGAIPEGTIDSELFGHEKGSFTGAGDLRKGYFEVTHGGTIFLDEVAELPLETQARLLRVLENKEFIRVGSSKIQTADVRVIAATNVDLLECVQKKKFREDLYYRLSTVPIKVPSLRERNGDILLLFRKFASDYVEKSNYINIAPIFLDKDAEQILLKYPFPGNIRQLKNIVDQISVLETKRSISAEVLRKYLPANRPISLLPVLAQQDGENFSERDLLYKILFDMKKDIAQLKLLLADLLKNEKIPYQVFAQYKNLLSSAEKPNKNVLASLNEEETFSLETNKNNYKKTDPLIKKNITPPYSIPSVVEEVAVNESLCLMEKEKEMIVKALEKFNYKKRTAAKQLGISERTLYRKIKDYGIIKQKKTI